MKMMTIKRYFLYLLAGILVSFVACNNSGKGSKDKADSINKSREAIPEYEVQFMTEAAMINMEEIELGKLAQQEAQSERVKSFGKMLVEDHTQLQNKVHDLASQKNIALPDSNTEKIQEAKKDLTNSDNFDKDFIDKMVEGHKDAIDLYKQARRDIADADVREFATLTVPQLQKHLDSAETLQAILQEQPE